MSRAGESLLPVPHDNIRANMMRSIVMEPLASSLALGGALGGDQPFDVIIWLNESFRDGVGAAAENVFEKTKPFDPAAIVSPPYCFARLSASQILQLAGETRATIR